MFIFQLLFIFFLVFLNGFFVASEFALVGVRKTRIDELAKKGNKRAKLVQKALTDLESYISSTQLGITLASLALGWVGEPVLAHFIEPMFAAFLPETIAFYSAHSVSVAIAFTLITILHIVLGELAPKTIALQRAEATSLIVIAPLTFFTTVFRPFIWFLNGAGNFVVRLMGLTSVSEEGQAHTEGEIKMILAQSQEFGELEQSEVEMVYNVFKLADVPVNHIMVSKPDIIAFPESITIEEAITQIKEYPHSRYPLYKDAVDHIVGFAHIRDIYNAGITKSHKDTFVQSGILRKILSVPETRKVDDVLLDMKRNHTHMAIVVDEYGDTVGMVTLEDVLESVVGDIEDEFDRPSNDIKKLKNGTYLIDGLVTIEEFEEKFKVKIKEKEFTTIGGWVFGQLGREPKIGDAIEINKMRLEVEALDGKRIKILRLKK